jgi:hypothetical protein
MHDWTLIGIGFIPIALGILTLLGIWIPGLRSYPKNSHQRPKRPLSTWEMAAASSFLIAFGLLLVWLGWR